VLSMLIGFALPSLLQLKSTPPARVLRKTATAPPLRFGLSYVLAFAALFAILWVLVRDSELVVSVLAGVLGVGLVLTLGLSLQASYAAPLILLAQNRQEGRDRVQYEQDRQRDERSIADTEYLVREVAALRIALGEVATRDFLRSELRDLIEELDRQGEREPRRQLQGDPPAGD